MAPSRSTAVTVAATAASIAGVLGTLYALDIPSTLQQRVKSRKVSPSRFSASDTPSLAEFRILTTQPTLGETYPLAACIEKGIPVYDCTRFKLADEKWVAKLHDELFHCLHSGPGVYVLKHFFTDLSVLDEANSAFERIIARESGSNDGKKGDHFSAGLTNSRIWNSFSKHCLEDPKSFVQYHSNPLFKLIGESWLGPAYRLTSQVNIVHPGGQAQTSHRDYHLGFQTPEATAKWPKEMHIASQFLTLQGAIAHTNMPLESGPTRFLPYSQKFEEGFVAYRRSEFNDYFLENYVSLPLEKGDAVFFNPAIFHAAGENTTADLSRSANLIQVSSAFGKTMESIDGVPLVEKCWDLIVEKHAEEGMSPGVDALILAIGEGYPFPTNSDRRPPAPDGMAPESEQDVLREGLTESWSKETMLDVLRKMREASGV